MGGNVIETCLRVDYIVMMFFFFSKKPEIEAGNSSYITRRTLTISCP